MQPDTAHRSTLAHHIFTALERGVPHSTALLRGSLAEGHADPYSDIDILWEIPDDLFEPSLIRLKTTLSSVRPAESLRSDPLLQNSNKHRLIYVRFADTPLFWRLDLAILARSIGTYTSYDRDNPSARGSNWSLTESALMNAIAAIKAHLRHNDPLAWSCFCAATRG